MSSLGKNIGFEQNGSGTNFSRPVLVIKKFNNHMFWCASLSTKQKKFDFYYNFTDHNGEKVSVILAQLKLVSVKRLKRKLYEIQPNTFKEIKRKIKRLLDIKSKPRFRRVSRSLSALCITSIYQTPHVSQVLPIRTMGK